MRAMRGILATALLLAAATAAADDAPVRFRGYAYDLASGKFLYTELHEQKLAGDRWLGGTIDYYAPDGTPVAHKDLDFSQDPYIPVYRLEIRTGGATVYMEGITAVSAERVEMTKQGYGEKRPETESVKRRQAMAADSGFHSFIRDHFAELLAGKTVAFVFGVAGNLDGYKFRAKKIGETTFEGKPAVKLRVEPDSLLRMLVDPLELSYDPAERRLLEYRGVSNIHDPATRAAYKAVRIIYPSAPPADAPPLPEPSKPEPPKAEPPKP
jgi:hypothetical protein